MDGNQIITKSEDILFRIWLYRSSGSTHGVIDLMRKRRDFYSDALESEIREDKFNILRLISRERGKDIAKKWYPLIEMNLLTPVSTKAIRPYHEHIFGAGKLCTVVDLKYRFTELDLQEVNIISPREFQNRGGLLVGDDWPDSYEVPPAPLPTVFLCHSSKDKPFVRRLAKELRNHEINVWFDEEDILVGQSFIERIQDGIQRADFVAVILTPNFVNAHWANRELEIALNHEVRTRKVKVLPILRRDCNIPDFLVSKSYADFRGKKFTSGIEALMRSILNLV